FPYTTLFRSRELLAHRRQPQRESLRDGCRLAIGYQARADYGRTDRRRLFDRSVRDHRRRPERARHVDPALGPHGISAMGIARSSEKRQRNRALEFRSKPARVRCAATTPALKRYSGALLRTDPVRLGRYLRDGLRGREWEGSR